MVKERNYKKITEIKEVDTVKGLPPNKSKFCVFNVK